MAGRKMRARKGNAHNSKYMKYSGEGRKAKNKEKRKVAHEKRCNKQISLSEKRKELETKALEMLKINKHGLKKLVGTLNINRLEDVVKSTFLDELWFIDREKQRQERKNAKKIIPQQKKEHSDSSEVSERKEVSA